ncbi:cation:dicarboxylate symporter family transporter [Rothia amarae]|uniref:Cation:dicarboxylase symporter family transporter n=1 Tax=Rothia amarae TaxID=169480 RepID=A0A7H2BHX2_9MICC|nr:cation:dicarboxylase symporter family transporter [Rothia amarae]QNV39268.1 cation:dicarboxylase symporter family transporter [Rothia amarae]SIL79286.1 Na+/H+ dicarboxylate symporter [Mycobacteroides abscessus subsp. abscessus]
MTATPQASKKKFYQDPTHMLYVSVIVAVVLGCIVGILFPGFAKSLAPIGTAFVALIKMMIAPIIFCTIVIGVGSVAKAATVGKVGGMALFYFICMSTFALAIGLVVGNFIHPGHDLNYQPTGYTPPVSAESEHGDGTIGFLLGIIPTSLLSALTSGNILQTLFVALLVGFALQRMGEVGKPVLKFITYMQALVFRLLMMIMWVAPLGAFGAIAGVVGSTGAKAIGSMLILMVGFYITCILFIAIILGGLLKLVTGVNIFKLMKYLAREYLLIFSTSSSEAALPRLIAKMEHLGVSKPVVGVVVPTGYSFNLDGTAIYLTMASIFVAEAMGNPLEIGEQISLLLFMIIASKGAAGVSGAGIATLAAGLQSHRPDLIDGVGLIVGIDRFMSEARALTNFTGNAVATVLLGKIVNEVDMAKVKNVLAGNDPFDESTMGNDHLEGDQHVDNAVAQKSPTKQIPVVQEPTRHIAVDDR